MCELEENGVVCLKLTHSFLICTVLLFHLLLILVFLTLSRLTLSDCRLNFILGEELVVVFDFGGVFEVVLVLVVLDVHLVDGHTVSVVLVLFDDLVERVRVEGLKPLVGYVCMDVHIHTLFELTTCC